MPDRPDLATIKKQHFAMTWINYPDRPAACYSDGKEWPCEVGVALDRVAALEAELAGAREALTKWLQAEQEDQERPAPHTWPAYAAATKELREFAARLGGGAG